MWLNIFVFHISWALFVWVSYFFLKFIIFIFIYMFLLTMWSVIWLGWLYNDTQDLTPNDYYVCWSIFSGRLFGQQPKDSFLKTLWKYYMKKNSAKVVLKLIIKIVSRFPIKTRIFWIRDAFLYAFIFCLHLLLVVIARDFV